VGKDIVKGFVATTDEVPVFGGVQLTEEALHELAKALSAGKVPMLADHDPRKPIEASILVAEVRPTERGSLGVWIEVEVPEGAVDGMRGFSYGAAMSVLRVGPEDAPPVGLFVDPSRATEAEIEQAADALAAVGLRVEAGVYLQFALSPEAVIVLSIALEALISIGASAIWDGIKKLVHPGESTELRFQLERADGEKITALVRTTDPGVAQTAIEELAPAVRDAVRLSYGSDGWKEIGSTDNQSP
jgi:hypothetical protein